MKRTITSISALALVITLVQPAQAQDAFNPDAMTFSPTSGVFGIGEPGSNEAFSNLVAAAKTGGDEWTCTDLKDPECAVSKIGGMQGRGVLPICESATDENCVVSLELAGKDGEFEPATYIRNTKGETFAADPALNFFEQSTPSLWDAPNAPSASGTTTYSVSVRVIQGRRIGFNGSKFESSRFFANVMPYREQAGNYETPYQMTAEGDPVRGGRSRSFAMGGISHGCAWNEEGLCGVVQDFAEGTRVRLTIRIAKTMGGWFKGRIKDPVISVRSVSSTNNEVSVQAEPATVQRMLYEVPDTKTLSAKEKEFVNYSGFAGTWENFRSFAGAADPMTFEYLDYFKPRLNDSASGKNTFWNFASTETVGFGSNCLADKSRVLGIVTTNSMVYDGDVPKFTRGFLNYKVAGLHYEADGITEVLGSYDLVMRSDVARCLYGFNKAPVSATITIAGEGDKSIATTVVGEKNGWLKLAAYGFTFSEKTIRVKITQPKRTTITCVTTSKPTKTKKVSGVNPKCPSGFKKR